MKQSKALVTVTLFVAMVAASAIAQGPPSGLLRHNLANRMSPHQTGAPVPTGLGSNPFALIDYPGAIAKQYALSINDKGRIVGVATSTDGSIWGYLLQGATFKQITFPGAPASAPTGINQSGLMVGIYCDDPLCDTTIHGFVLKGKNYTALDYPGGMNTGPSGVNAAGDIVGSYQSADEITHGFLLHKGVFTSFDAPLAGLVTAPASINKQGQIVGFFYQPDDTNIHGFLLQNGVFTQVDYPGAAGTVLNAINDSGDILGEYFDGSGGTYSFLLSGGAFTTFNVPFPGSDFTAGFGMNNHRQIVGGYGTNGSDYFFGFLTTY